MAPAVIMVLASGSGATAAGMAEAGAEDGGIDTGRPVCLGGGECTLLPGEDTMARGIQTTARTIPRKMNSLHSRKKPPG